jgi:hypothetical protein
MAHGRNHDGITKSSARLLKENLFPEFQKYASIGLHETIEVIW